MLQEVTLQIVWGSAISYQLSIRRSRITFYKHLPMATFIYSNIQTSWFFIHKMNRHPAAFKYRCHLLNQDKQLDRQSHVGETVQREQRIR